MTGTDAGSFHRVNAPPAHAVPVPARGRQAPVRRGGTCGPGFAFRFSTLHRQATGKRDRAMLEITGLGGLLVLVLDIWAIVSVIGSGAGTGSKVLWILLILILPLIGFIIWLIAGPRSAPAP